VIGSSDEVTRITVDLPHPREKPHMTSPLSAEQCDLLALHLVPGLGPRLTAALLERFGSAAVALQATAEELRTVPHIGAKLSQELSQAMRQLDVNAELELMARHQVRLLTQGAPDYPSMLAELTDRPPLLYLRGSVEARDANAVALVGSRHCTPYGRRVTEQLAAGLVRAGVTVVSGLARGIDGAAHRGALQSGGRTLAVLAGGLSRIYPPEHADLARAVEASGGLLSEATMAQEPLAAMFPARNRIISGLSRGVVIIEAAERSGALITAHHAIEQGRPVFAVPGPIDSLASAGTHALIREGAILVRGVDDILEELDGIRAPVRPAAPTAAETPAAPPRPSGPPPGLDETQRRIWELLAEQPRHLDEITQKLGIPVGALSSTLLQLEMKKVVRRLPGNRFERG
jgi:DNA processing protein